MDPNSFRFSLLSYHEEKIGIVTQQHLVIANAANSDTDQSDLEPSITIALPEINGRPSAIKWVNSDILCLGFESGYVAGYSCDGFVVFELGCEDSPVQSFRVSNRELSPNQGTAIWMLFESGSMLSV